ncbi:MAG: hypothetical protein PVI81_07725 [Anaerolineales bacterium]
MAHSRTSLRVKKVEKIPPVGILHHREQGGAFWGTHGRWILHGVPGGNWNKIARFPFASPRDYFGFSRPTARAMRADKSNLYLNRAGKLLGIRAGQVYRLKSLGQLERLFHIQGDSVLHGGITEDLEGWTYFGEYFMNPSRVEVVIWRLAPDLKTWEPAHRFKAGTIRHVHGVYIDPYDPEALWVPVGDYEGECFFYRTRDRFNTLNRFGDGSQLWRAVRLFFTPEHVCWLTDSQLEQNYACRMSRQTGELEVGQALGAPAWYGARTEEGVYIAFTTVEPGPAVQRKSAAVLASSDAFHWQEIYTFRKDFWRPMKVFKYGVISCPSGSVEATALPVSGEGLVGLDGLSALIHLAWDR